MKMKLFYSICIGCIMLFQNCNQKKKETVTQKETVTPTTEVQTFKLEEAWATEPLLKTPESVIYDEARDVLYVSNVNENPWEKDNNGFIAKISTSGEILELDWVSGFSGPKGMAILDNKLFVADLDEVGIIDIEAGELIEKIKIDGASGLNDITPGENGKLFISDSNGGKLYQYLDGEITILHNDTPGRPNGLLMYQNKLLVAFSQASEFVSFELGSLNKTIIATDIGGGDGITPTNEKGKFLVSDWNGEIFMIDLNGEKQSLLNTKDQSKNTADIWFILEENLVLVPTFFDNRIVAYTLIKE